VSPTHSALDITCDKRYPCGKNGVRPPKICSVPPYSPWTAPGLVCRKHAECHRLKATPQKALLEHWGTGRLFSICPMEPWLAQGGSPPHAQKQVWGSWGIPSGPSLRHKYSLNLHSSLPWGCSSYHPSDETLEAHRREDTCQKL
jgi:hypothetical protein